MKISKAQEVVNELLNRDKTKEELFDATTFSFKGYQLKKLLKILKK